MLCKQCGKYYQVGEREDTGFCNPCEKKPFDKQKFLKKMKEVVFILKTQNRLKDYMKIIEKIVKTPVLSFHYNKFNVAELLFKLELDRRGWNIESQYGHLGFRHDFYIIEFNLDIEIDERGHNRPKQRAKDRERDLILGKRNVLRVPEQIVRTNIVDAVDLIPLKIIMNCRNIDVWEKELNRKFKAAGMKVDIRYYLQERFDLYNKYLKTI